MKIINIAEQPHFDASGIFRWIADQTDPSIQWTHFSTAQHPQLLKIKWPHPARYVAAFRAVWRARQTRADLIVSHDTLMAAWIGIFKHVLGVRTPHLAWSFTLPYHNPDNVITNAVMRFAVKNIDRFIMYSIIETKNYPAYMKRPADRFHMIPWSMKKPEFDQQSPPIIQGHYIAAMGGEGRDYKTLVNAMARLPEIKLVIVARPENLKDIDIPKNVEVLTNIPYQDAMNIAWHSDFMVLPLLSDSIPCGHGSLLAQFLLHKATILTDSTAMEGYSFHGENVLTYKAQDTDALSKHIKTLWAHPEQAQALADKALDFAESHCSEASTVQYFHDYLNEKQLLAPAPLSRSIHLASGDIHHTTS